MTPSPADTLAARQAAVKAVIAACGDGVKSKDQEDTVYRMLVVLAEQAAGLGFDEGVKFIEQYAKI